VPLFTTELNRLADSIGAADLTIRLHTAAPTNVSPTNGRVSSGGGRYSNGATLAATSITNAANGDIQNNAVIDFGTATANVGTVTHWSAYRGNTPVAYGTVPSTVIASGDRFQINANSLRIMGSTS